VALYELDNSTVTFVVSSSTACAMRVNIELERWRRKMMTDDSSILRRRQHNEAESTGEVERCRSDRAPPSSLGRGQSGIKRKFCSLRRHSEAAAIIFGRNVRTA